MRDYLQRKLNFLRNENISVPALLLFTVLIAYGLLIPWIGFYWDDLPFAWSLRFLGSSEFIESFRPFRPVLGYFFAATTSLFGGHPLTWQILGLIVRFLLGLEVWILFRQVWSRRRVFAVWAALLFTLYPAYQQQWVALTHINQELIPFLGLLASFILTVRSVRMNRFSMSQIIPAVLLQVLGLVSTEYFFGLEILRFLFILVVLGDVISDGKALLKRSLLIWLPYLIVWVLSGIWLYAYHRSTAYSSYEINFLSALAPLSLINEFLNTLSVSAIAAWFNGFNLFKAFDGSLTQIIAAGIFVVTAILVFTAIRIGFPLSQDLKKEDDRFGWEAVIIGLVGIFAGRLPSWTIGLPLRIEFDYDRFFVSIMLGASLLAVGAVELLFRDGRRKYILLSILVGISAANQFSVANTFRRDWANERQIFWQMAWRMPALQRGTAVLTSDFPLQFASDLQLTAPLNWMYVPDFSGHTLSYAMLNLKSRFTMSELQADQPITLPYRTASFTGDTSHAVVIYKEADGCLRVLDPVYNNAATVPGASPYLIAAIPLSNLDLIQTDAPLPEMDKIIFGSEPAHDWCYLYSQSEIHRATGEWNAVSDLYHQAQKDELMPTLPVEYLPFIEASARTGDPDTALKLTSTVVREQKLLCPAVVQVWERVPKDEKTLTEVNAILQKGCSPASFSVISKGE